MITVTTPATAAAITTLRDLGLTDAEVSMHDEVRASLGSLSPEDVTVALVKADVPVRGLVVTRPALEDLFVQLTGEGFDVVR
jgi:ABC-2 type transport system ATP-binding protein